MNSGDAPFSIQADSIRGRYLEAAKDISQGDIIFQERPLMVGPCGVGIEKSKTFSTCLGCYKNVTSFYKCSKCGWPVCNFQCEMVSTFISIVRHAHLIKYMYTHKAYVLFSTSCQVKTLTCTHHLCSLRWCCRWAPASHIMQYSCLFQSIMY